MNELLAKLGADMRSALKAGEKDRLQVIRLMIAGLERAQLDRKSDDMTEDEEIAVLRKQIKSCRDSVQQAEDAGRRDIADRERAEIEIIASYLPELLSGEALLERVRAVAAEIGYSGPQDKGRFMKEWMSRFRGQAEGRDVQSALAGLDTA